MSKRWSMVLVAVLALISVAATPALADNWDDQSTPDPDGSIALAERLSLGAQLVLHSEQMVPAMWRQSAALFQAACRLDPTEPRFARFLADEEIQINDVPAAIKALAAYRALKKDDETAQTQQIELYLSQMQSADEKINYCRALLQRDGIPPSGIVPAVRSFVAVRCAQLMVARSQTTEALKMLNASLSLNHLNIAALRMKYSLTDGDAVPLERVGELLAMIRSNPADPDVVAHLAEQLAALGMVPESMGWFNIAMGLYNHSGTRPDAQFALGAASELVLSDRADDAGRLLSEYLQANPGDVDAWYLALTIAKTNSDQGTQAAKDLYTKLLHQAGISLLNNLNELRHLAGVQSATTQPIDSPGDITAPDLSGDVAMLRKNAKPELSAAYAAAASSLAWYDLYYRGDIASADPILATLGSLLGEQDLGLIRLRGWRALVAGDSDTASAKFASAGANDPYATLGIIQIDQKYPNRHDQMLASARKLMANHPSGPFSVVLWEAVHGLGVTVTPATSAVPIDSALNLFPRDFLSILDQPTNFYSLHVEPIKSAFAYGEPILLRISVQNLTNYDLTIGPDGILHRDLWFDAHLRGDADQNMPGVAIARLDQRLVLGEGQSITMIVRADDGPLNQLCAANPMVTLELNMSMCSNPTMVHPDPKGPVMAVHGPAGYPVQLSRMLQRTSVAMNSPEARAALLAQLKDSDGGRKIIIMDALSAFSSWIRSNPDAKDEAKAVADDLMNRVKKMRDDPSPSVRAVSMFITANGSQGEDRNAALADMMKSKDWQTRLSGLIASGRLDDRGAAMAASLSNDTDPTIAAFAKAMTQVIVAIPSTQPAAAVQP